MGRIRKGEGEFSEVYDVPVAIDASNIEALTQSSAGDTVFAEMYSGNVHELVGDLEENLHLLRNVFPPEPPIDAD